MNHFKIITLSALFAGILAINATAATKEPQICEDMMCELFQYNILGPVPSNASFKLKSTHQVSLQDLNIWQIIIDNGMIASIGKIF